MHYGFTRNYIAVQNERKRLGLNNPISFMKFPKSTHCISDCRTCQCACNIVANKTEVTEYPYSD
jgi:hypothetical protein